MPGGKGKKAKKNKAGKRQSAESSQKRKCGDVIKTINSGDECKVLLQSPVNLDDAILVEDIISDSYNNNNNNNQILDKKSPYEDFVSQVEPKEMEKLSASVTKTTPSEEKTNVKASMVVGKDKGSSQKKNVNESRHNQNSSNLEEIEDLITKEDFLERGVPLEIIEMKHPLASTWVFWWYKNDKSKTWDQNQREVATVETVEDFWQVFNYIELASNLDNGSDYAVFKKGIRPDWEDFQNMFGGRWLIVSDKNNRKKELDNQWLEILFILIGEHAGRYAHLVNGAVINIRPKADKLAVWLKGSTEGVRDIGLLIKSRLNLRERIDFKIHKEESKVNRSRYGSQNSPSKIYV